MRSSQSKVVKHDTRFVSVNTLAKRWDMSPRSVSRKLEQAGVHAYYFGGCKRYLKDDVDLYVKMHVERA